MLDNRIAPPFLVVLMGFAMWVVAHWSDSAASVSPWRWPLAVAIGASGLAVLLLGARAFARANTTIDPVHIDRASTLVTTGIFRVTRNPMYVGLTLIVFAWASFLAVPWGFVGPVLFVCFINRFQVVPEERVMLEKFGDSYKAYQLTVRRWL